MERSRQNVWRNFVAAVLYALLIAPPVRTQIKCSNYHYSDRCTIQNLIITLPEVDSLKFPVQENIELTNLSVDYISPQVMERMKWVSKLTISNGRVGKIYLKPELKHLSATRSNTFEVIIGAEQNEDLELLSVTFNELRNVPEHIGKLKALTTLQLSGNRIEVLDMNKCHGLEKLATLDLSNNKLYYVAPVQDLALDSLKTLDLSKNYLTEIDTSGWNMPLLQKLTLSSNHLTHLSNVQAAIFPSLQRFDLTSNLFDCRWWNRLSNEQSSLLSRRDLYSNHQIECTKTTHLSPATYLKLNMSDIRSSAFQFDSKERLEEQINVMAATSQDQSKKIESLAASVTKQAKQLAEANAKLEQQQALIDNLLTRIESLYEQMGKLKEYSNDMPVGEFTASKGLSAKLIREIAEVIRKNLPEEGRASEK